MRIAELAEQAGIATSTVRYYERIGLMPNPSRTESGYRSYDDDASARLLFITRAKRIGLTLDEVADLLTTWDGVNCAATQERVGQLVEKQRTEVLAQIGEMKRFLRQLDGVRAALEETPPLATCLPDGSCCIPSAGDQRTTTLVHLTGR